MTTLTERLASLLTTSTEDEKKAIAKVDRAIAAHVAGAATEIDALDATIAWVVENWNHGARLSWDVTSLHCTTLAAHAAKLVIDRWRWQENARILQMAGALNQAVSEQEVA